MSARSKRLLQLCFNSGSKTRNSAFTENGNLLQEAPSPCPSIPEDNRDWWDSVTHPRLKTPSFSGSVLIRNSPGNGHFAKKISTKRCRMNTKGSLRSPADKVSRTFSSNRGKTSTSETQARRTLIFDQDHETQNTELKNIAVKESCKQTCKVKVPASSSAPTQQPQPFQPSGLEFLMKTYIVTPTKVKESSWSPSESNDGFAPGKANDELVAFSNAKADKWLVGSLYPGAGDDEVVSMFQQVNLCENAPCDVDMPEKAPISGSVVEVDNETSESVGKNCLSSSSVNSPSKSETGTASSQVQDIHSRKSLSSGNVLFQPECNNNVIINNPSISSTSMVSHLESGNGPHLQDKSEVCCEADQSEEDDVSLGKENMSSGNNNSPLGNGFGSIKEMENEIDVSVGKKCLACSSVGPPSKSKTGTAPSQLQDICSRKSPSCSSILFEPESNSVVLVDKPSVSSTSIVSHSESNNEMDLPDKSDLCGEAHQPEKDNISLEKENMTSREGDSPLKTDSGVQITPSFIVVEPSEYLPETEENDILADNVVNEELIEDLLVAGIDTSEEVIVFAFDSPESALNQNEINDQDQASFDLPSNLNTSDIEQPKQSRLRTRNPDEWKKNKTKLLKDSGLPHTSLKNKQVPAKVLGPGCDRSCRLKCSQRLPQVNRQIIFEKFYSIKEHTRQWDFITRHAESMPVKRRTTSEDDICFLKRKRTLTYHFKVNEEKVRVCRKMFCDTLAVSPQWIQTAFAKLGPGGSISPDKRGRHKNKGRRFSREKRAAVIEHIRKYPVMESHYVRKSCKRKYLADGLNVRIMHLMYSMEQADNNLKVTVRQYRDIFNENFNYGFHRPKKDECATCISWKNKTPQEQNNVEAKEKYNKHIFNKAKAREHKAADAVEGKSKTGMCVTTFDLEKVLECPKINSKQCFYYRKLSVFNLTCFDAVRKQAYCFVWDQTIAGRSANDIASCVFKYIEMLVAKGVNDFRQYSDNCSSPNKNYIIFTMYYIACMRFNIKVTQRYLESGHTQMECDSVHARIEKKVSNVNVYTPFEFYGLMRSAKVNPPPYQVIEMDQTCVYNIAALGKLLNWSNVPTSKVREISFDCKTPGRVSFKTDFGGDETTVQITAKQRGRPINWKAVQLEPAYSGKLPVDDEKYKDLQKSKEQMPVTYHAFWDTVRAKHQVAQEEENNSVDEPELLAEDDSDASEEWVSGSDSSGDEENDQDTGESESSDN